MQNKSKTPLFSTLRKAFRLALAADQNEMTAEEAVQRDEEMRRSRRRFLQNTSKTMLGAAILPQLLAPGKLSATNRFLRNLNAPKIAIVGGGIAGLHALHILKKHQLDATIYESSGRLGGRIFTVQEAMGAGTWTEYGGEFIDTDHKDMWDLAAEFKLELIDYEQESEHKLKKEAYFFDGKHYSLAQLVAAFQPIARRMKRDMEKLPDDISYKTKDPFTKKLDNTSLSTYLANIGATGWIKRFIEVAYEAEYGLSPKVQSSLNLTLLISPEIKNGAIELFGTSDERYKIRGGNQSIPNALAKLYANHLETNRSLESIRAKGSQYALYFSGAAEEVIADFVILAIPFTTLRNLSVELEMPAVKRNCINQLGYGTNAKLMIGTKNHHWRTLGYTGLTYAGNGIPNGWDNAQLQTPDEGPAGLSILFGGPSGVAVCKGSPEHQKDIYLPKWEQIYPGTAAAFNGKVARMNWPTYTHNLGSYVCPTLGQYTSIGGAEQMPLGNVFFAGEHCGGDFAGFMNGAAQSGREAAEAIIAKVD